MNTMMRGSPGEVNGGVAVIFWKETGGVAMGESAEKGVGEQAGDLKLWQSNGCSVSLLKQGDALKTKTTTVTAACLWAGGAAGVRTFITQLGSFRANAAIFRKSALMSISSLTPHWKESVLPLDFFFNHSQEFIILWIRETCTSTNAVRASKDHWPLYFGLYFRMAFWEQREKVRHFPSPAQPWRCENPF